MQKLIRTGAIVVLGLSGGALAEDVSPSEALVAQHLAAQAMLTSRFVAAAKRAGMSTQEIDAVLVEGLIDQYLVNEARLTARYVAAAKEAGLSTRTINAALTEIAEESAIDEFWVSNEDGEVVYTNVPDSGFVFPTDPAEETQAAPYALLLTGEVDLLSEPFEPRTLDGRVFKYVGAAGIDTPRIVQVGVHED